MARVYVCCNTKQELRDTISKIHSTVKVVDDQNNNQLINGFNYE